MYKYVYRYTNTIDEESDKFPTEGSTYRRQLPIKQRAVEVVLKFSVLCTFQALDLLTCLSRIYTHYVM